MTASRVRARTAALLASVVVVLAARAQETPGGAGEAALHEDVIEKALHQRRRSIALLHRLSRKEHHGAIPEYVPACECHCVALPCVPHGDHGKLPRPQTTIVHSVRLQSKRFTCWVIGHEPYVVRISDGARSCVARISAGRRTSRRLEFRLRTAGELRGTE